MIPYQTHAPLPRRSPTTGERPRYVEPYEWNLLGRAVALPYQVLLFEARRTIVAHTAVVRVDAAVPDPRARWRDLIRPGPTTYRRVRRHCRSCDEDGSCPLLDAARWFEEIITPYLHAEGAG